MLEGFKWPWGGKTGSDAAPVGERHYEATDVARTGIKVEGFTHDTGTPVETAPVEEDERFGRIKKGIQQILEETGIPPQDALGRQDFFADKLVEKGILSARDAGFEGIIKEIVKAAREVSLEGIENAGRDKDWKKAS